MEMKLPGDFFEIYPQNSNVHSTMGNTVPYIGYWFKAYIVPLKSVITEPHFSYSFKPASSRQRGMYQSTIATIKLYSTIL